MKRFPWDKQVITRTYRYGKRKQTKIWRRKKSRDKKGFMRYSSGPKWSGQFDYNKPAFWRRWQPELKHVFREDEMLPSGYSKDQAWVSLCKSWNGFMNAQREGDRAGTREYVGQILKLQKDLGLEQTEFEGYTPAELAKIDLENDETFGNIEILYRRSIDGGATFSVTENLSNNVGVSQRPEIAASENNLYIVWDDSTIGNLEIFYIESSDSGATFEDIINLSNNEGDSWIPAIATFNNLK